MQTIAAMGGADLGRLGLDRREAGLRRRRLAPAEADEVAAVAVASEDAGDPNRTAPRPAVSGPARAERPSREIRIVAAARAFADAAALGVGPRLDLRA